MARPRGTRSSLAETRVLSRRVIACVIALGALTSCSPPPAPVPPDPSADIQAAFRDLQDAIAAKDWKSCIGCFELSAKEGLLLAACMDATLAGLDSETGQPGCLKIFARHGAGGLPMDGPVNMADREKMKALIAQQFAGVKDKSAFFADLIEYTETRAKPSATTVAALIPTGTITNIRARQKGAKADLTRPGGAAPEPIRFVKRDGRWLVYFGTFKDWPD